MPQTDGIGEEASLVQPPSADGPTATEAQVPPALSWRQCVQAAAVVRAELRCKPPSPLRPNLRRHIWCHQHPPLYVAPRASLTRSLSCSSYRHSKSTVCAGCTAVVLSSVVLQCFPVDDERHVEHNPGVAGEPVRVLRQRPFPRRPVHWCQASLHYSRSRRCPFSARDFYTSVV